MTPATAVVLWALLAAPKSPRRLTPGARVPLELGVFGLAALALFAAGSTVAAIVLGTLMILNAALLTVFDQHRWRAAS